MTTEPRVGQHIELAQRAKVATQSNSDDSDDTRENVAEASDADEDYYAEQEMVEPVQDEYYEDDFDEEEYERFG